MTLHDSSWPAIIRATCLDCGLPFDWEHNTQPRLCEACVEWRQEHKKALNDESPIIYPSVFANVELVWALTAEDVRYKHYGDMEKDFLQRSFYRMRDVLDALVTDGKLKHWALTGELKRGV